MDAGSLLTSMFLSSVGLGLFMYGKRMARAPQIIVGLILMVYSYFVSSVVLMLAIGALLLLLLWLALHLGW